MTAHSYSAPPPSIVTYEHDGSTGFSETLSRQLPDTIEKEKTNQKGGVPGIFHLRSDD